MEDFKESHLEVIWCEIVRHVKYLEREWTDGVPLSFRRN